MGYQAFGGVSEMVGLTLMKDHDVSSHSPYVDSVLCSANIIRCVIDAHDLVMVDAIVFEENVFVADRARRGF